ncbi:MAG TPA: tripartite tricarboxylate transporter permease, partial [Candidatus Methanofastidiosa archaeon]|nr:tripartite tricarboxylate transporter permease [Candidatus Methanofastidiosa archaeon]
MSLEIVLYCVLGVACGTFTGLVPGIHVNTAAPIALGMSQKAYLDPLFASVFICSMSITHTFIDFIPATVLGVPDPDMSLAVLPAHSMVLSGRGWEAISLSGVASLVAVVFIALCLPVLMPAIEVLYPMISSSTLPIL